jgi:hypothetical protein
VDDGIQAVRTLLPRCWFDAERCARDIEARASTGANTTTA